MQKIIPMTKATGLGPMPLMLEQQASGKALHRIFRQENVPMGVLEDRETRMPLISMMGMFESAAREVGSRTFGLSVGMDMSHANYGMWLIYSASAPTLGEALRRTAITARFQQSGSRLIVAKKGSFAIWRYIVPVSSERSVQHADHILGPMMRFVQSFLGWGWNPEWVELSYPRDNAAHLLERELRSPVQFGCRCIGIAMRLDQLKVLNPARNAGVRPSQKRSPLTLLDVGANEVMLEQFEEPVQSLYSIVVLRLLDGHSDVDGAARMAGLGVQTFQRILRREGLTYRGLLDAARRGKACSLLKETSQNITEIAFGLGYSDHANFTRAFGRWMSCSPREYRRAMSVPS